MHVYRLEDQNGYGPFWGNQDAIGYLISHKDPEKMLKDVGLNRKCFNRLCTLGWKFAWATPELADKFFSTPSGKDRVNSMGFSIKEKNALRYIKFPDGQVMFKDDNV